MRPILVICLFLAASSLLFSCAFAPVNNQYEKAGTLKKGNIELSGAFTGYTAAGGSENINTNNNLGFRVGYGVSDKFDLKFRYERLMPGSNYGKAFDDEDFKGANYFSVIPKFAIIPEKLSFSIPVNYYSFSDEFDGEGNASLAGITPQLFYTFTNGKNTADFTLGVKADCFLGGGVSLFPGATIGAGFSKDLSKWAVRPEVGATFIGSGSFLSYGLGLQLIIPGKSK